MPTLQSTTLALALIAASHITTRCIRPPNATPTSPAENRPSDRGGQGKPRDRIRFITGLLPLLGAHMVRLAFVYQATTVLLWTATPRDALYLSRICPGKQNLDPAILTWSATSILSLLAIASGGALRLSAYGGLGPNFTFHLAQPDHLITDGVYGYLQHPSYSGLALVEAGTVPLLLRWDAAAIGCWMEQWMQEQASGKGMVLAVLGVIVTGVFITVRVRDEERMLRERFGKVWEDWHARTARFVPGLW